jgi:hypothetical protein
MPSPFVYVRWTAHQGSSGADGESLEVLFGHHGRKIEWFVEDAQDPAAESHGQCGTRKPFANTVSHVDGRTVYYIGGAVGQAATICMPAHHGVTAWNDYSLSRAALVKLAASAYAVG